MSTLSNLCSILCSIALLTACASTPRPRYYALDTANSGAEKSPAAAPVNTTVYIGPVTVPEAVDRPQLVVRQADNQLGVLEGQRWIEPLKVAMGRVLASTLTAELGGAIVGAYPGTALNDAAYRVQVDVQKLETSPTGETRFDAVWSIRRANGGNAFTGRTSGTPAGGGDYRALAAAYTEVAVSIGRDVAHALRTQVLGRK